MSDHLDSSVLVAALLDVESHHEACLALLSRSGFNVWVHALPETFNTITGGKLSHRISASLAAESIDLGVMTHVKAISLSGRETIAAIKEAESRGVRGGAIYDYLHLVAARNAKAKRFFTLNVRHFVSFHRPGDPEIVHP